MTSAKTNNEMSEKVQELQILEQNFQNILLQKQAFQLELDESKKASEEIKKSGDEIYKIIGNIMIKTDKKDSEEEINKKIEICELRLKTLEKQEKTISEKLEKLKQEFSQKAK